MNYLKIIALLIIITSMAKSQQPENTKPIELPNVIIEGKEQLNVRSGTKQFPDKSQPMTKSELDSLNNLEKQSTLLIPPKQLSTEVLAYQKYYGLFIGEFGRYLTPLISASYTFSIQDYDFFVKSTYEGSQGHQTNADYNNFSLKLATDNIASQKYWIFGGSRTRADIFYEYQTFKTYAVIEPEKVTSNYIEANVNSIGDFEGFDFEVGGNFQLLTHSIPSHTLTETELSGNLKITKTIDRILWGGYILLEYDTYNNLFPSLFQSNVVFGLDQNNIQVNLDAGFQIGHNSVKVAKFAPYLNARCNYLLDQDITLSGYLKNYLNEMPFLEYYRTNIYISDTSLVDFGNTFSIGGSITYYPTENLSLTSTIEYSNYSNYPFFERKNSPYFLLNYDNANSIKINIETDWKISAKDRVTGTAIFTKAIISYKNNIAPHIPQLKLTANYERFWSEKINSQFSFIYLSERFADKENTRKLKGFLDFRAKVEYVLFDNMIIYAKAEDLFNSNIEIWEGYKERNLFFAVGCKIRF